MISFHSTRNNESAVTIEQAIISGLAPDGGLYVPQIFPTMNIDHLREIADYPEFAYHTLKPFFIGSELESTLREICHGAFDFPLPLQKLDSHTQVLELFHGPTLSFKDFGARFLARCLDKLNQQRTILVATSGDTGSAVASACHGLENITCLILFPQGKVTSRQQHQITCWHDNVHALAVKGNFDDCQKLVKNAFSEQRWQKANLSTANSINIARLLPQMVYYAYTSLQSQAPANFIVPSGNLGNVTACYWAKQCGFPIDEIAIATNANKVLSDFVESHVFKAQASIHTLANAMDVGNPSNFERLQHLFNTPEELIQHLQIASIGDQQIRKAILECHEFNHYLLCPHTATAFSHPCRQKHKRWTLIATAHPAKFETTLEPLLNRQLKVPSQLQCLLKKETKFTSIANDSDVLHDYYQKST